MTTKRATRAKQKAPATWIKLPKLAPWKRTPLEPEDEDEDEDEDDRTDASPFDLLTATNDSVDYEDLFGAVPEHVMVHTGDVTVSEPVSLRGWDARKGSQQTLYVIDGDLTIRDLLVFSQSDLCTTLWVKGALRAPRVALSGSAVLIVGSLHVEDVLLTNLEDAGHLIVHGPCEARVWLDLTFRGSIELDERPKGRYCSDDPRDERAQDEGPFLRGSFAQAPLASAIAAALLEDGAPSYGALLDALTTGRPLLR